MLIKLFKHYSMNTLKSLEVLRRMSSREIKLLITKKQFFEFSCLENQLISKLFIYFICLTNFFICT